MIQFFKIFILVCCLTHAGVIRAESKFEVRVAIVDVQSILENSLAVQNIRKFIDSISQDIQKEVAKKEAALKKIEDELIKKRGSLSDEAFDKEVNIFNQKVSEAQKDLQNKKSRLEQTHSEAIGKVHETTIAIITDLAEKNKFNLVIPSSQVLFAKSELNITPEVIKLLNNKLKTVEVNYNKH